MYASHAADDADTHILIGSREHLSAILLIYCLEATFHRCLLVFSSSLKVSGSERGGYGRERGKLFLTCQPSRCSIA